MQRFLFTLFVLVLIVSGSALAQTSNDSYFSLHFAPEVSVPLGRDREAFLLGGSSRLKAVDAALAGRFSYLERRGEQDSARAAEAEGTKEVTVWEAE